MTTDELDVLRDRWGRTFEITYERGLYRARRFGTRSAISAPTAAGLDEPLSDGYRLRPYPQQPPRSLAVSRDYLHVP